MGFGCNPNKEVVIPKATAKTLLCPVLAALALLLFFTSSVTAQSKACDQNLTPVPGAVGYSWRAEGPRCEGLYKSTVSSVRLQLISVLRGGLAFDLAKHRNLNVSAPEVPTLAGRPVRVRAVALPLKTYYRMDAVLPPGGTLHWPLYDIISSADLSASEIGVYGWVEDDNGQLFIPLLITSNDNATTGATMPPIRIIVRSAVNLEQLVWRTVTEDGKELDRQEYPEAPLRAGRPIVLTLAEGKTAVLQVEIAGLPSQSDRWTKIRLRILRTSG